MAKIALLGSTGDPGCDRILRGVVGIFESCFPGRVRGYYLRGSHASGTATAGSDLDLFVLFADQFTDGDEFARARQLADDCAQLTSVLLEVLPIGECGARRDPVIGLNLKLASRLIYGDDVRDQLPGFDRDSWVRAVVHTPYYSYALPEPRHAAKALSYPLQHLDPDGEFYGFDQWMIPSPAGGEATSTKLLVATVGWTATAIIALKAGVYVADKTACVDLYQRIVGDEWTSLVTNVHDLCRRRWHYLVPHSPDDRATLRELCNKALDFCNHFLGLYREYQLTELTSDDPEHRLLAAERLRQIVFDDAKTNRLLTASEQPPMR